MVTRNNLLPRLLSGLLALLLACLALPVAAQGPRRVVSINLCTDQLAMQLAAPGQLVSVSYLARDPRSSAMARQAAALPVNHGRAEEIFLLRPDLVLAGSFSAPATLALLRRTGVPVEVFPPETDLAGIRATIAHMGRVLGRDAQAQAMLTGFDADLARLPAPANPRPTAALYETAGHTSGSDSLAGQIVRLAGYANIADQLGLTQGGTLSLEQLLLARPDLVILGPRYPGHARAQDLLDHPALRALLRDRASATISDRDWICGTPRILRGAASLRATQGTTP